MKPRFQFRLRTLLIGVALLSVPLAYLAHEYRIVAEREAWAKLHDTPTDMTIGIGYDGNQEDGPGPIRRLLGDEARFALTLVDPQPGDVQTARRLFPEAHIFEFHH